MKKDLVLKSIKECFDKIIDGDKEDSRLAAREVRKILYSSRCDKDRFKDIKNIINNAPANYTMISENWRQVNFVLAVSVIYYLHDEKKDPDFLFSWFFQLLQHSSGIIRYAVVKMISQELGPLTVHIRFPIDKTITRGGLTPEKADGILFSLYINLNNLLSVLWEPKYKRYKYINSLPTCPYKSVQMIMAEFDDMCGRDYIKQM